MPDRLVFWKGNRNPAITETITIDGTPVDLTLATVKFQMRAVGSTTLKVDAAATIVTPLAGAVQYSWAAADVDTASTFLIWWRVTTGGKTQDVSEAIIEFRDHAPIANTYVELERAKETISTSGFSHADGDLSEALESASRAVDDICGRRFYLDADATSVRYYTADSIDKVYIDDLSVLTSLETDSTGDGVYERTWTTSDYQKEPINNPSDSKPYTYICRKPLGSQYFPSWVPNGVKVTGQFGWSTVPAQVKSATMILAGMYMKRMREAPFGIVGVESLVRLGKSDPQVMGLLQGISLGHAMIL